MHPQDGAVEAWRNLAVDTPSTINWVPYSGRIAAGVDFAGANIKFAYLNRPRTGRADVSGSFLIPSPFSSAFFSNLNDLRDLRARSAYLGTSFCYNDGSKVLFTDAHRSVIYHLIARALPNVMVD